MTWLGVKHGIEGLAMDTLAALDKAISVMTYRAMSKMCPINSPHLMNGCTKNGQPMWGIVHRDFGCTFFCGTHDECSAHYAGMVARWFRKEGAPPVMEMML